MKKTSRLLFGALWLLGLGSASAWAQAVSTYHDDTSRTGWNKDEKTLTVANVGGGSFGLVATTTLDNEVDSQPLVIPKQKITGHGTHTVVYVVTAGDTVYAIDGTTGAVLLSRNFGTPITRAELPGGCSSNGDTVGITSTPVIDTATGTMYLIADTYENSAAVFRLHALSLSTLADTITPVVITASATLTDGTSYTFDANVERQRPALLLSGGNLYAAFGSYCDQATNLSRGWLLGWTASTLAPLAHNRLQDKVPTSQASYFLNSIWMSGFGPSTEAANSPIYVVTSNSDSTTYGSANRDESVMQFSPNLATTQGYYTDPNYVMLDAKDKDLGSGGAMLAPSQPGQDPNLLFAAGKIGTMYMFERSGSAALNLLASYSIGDCWCGPSYFTGSDGIGRLVTGGGRGVIVWKINTSADAIPTLTQQASATITTGQDPGVFTTVSSNGTKAGTAVIWTVGRPTAEPGTLPLYAIDPDTGNILYTASTGNWIYSNANANTTPTVSDGHVYVATYQEMAIFGLGSKAKNSANKVFAAVAAREAAQLPIGFQLKPDQHAIWGTIQEVDQTEMVLKTRTGELVRVDLGAARDAGNVAEPVEGEAAVAIGRFAPGGLLVASNVEHAKSAQALWPQDQ